MIQLIIYWVSGHLAENTAMYTIMTFILQVFSLLSFGFSPLHIWKLETNQLMVLIEILIGNEISSKKSLYKRSNITILIMIIE